MPDRGPCASDYPALRAESLEGEVDDGGGEVVYGDGAVGAVPLDEGVHHAEQQSADQLGGDVGAERALVDGGLHEARELVVDHPPALERGQLDLAVAAHAQ